MRSLYISLQPRRRLGLLREHDAGGRRHRAGHRPRALKVKTQIFEACNAAITNILQGLQGIANLYPRLVDISSSAKIVATAPSDPLTLKPNRVSHHFRSRKNAKEVKLAPDEKGRAPSMGSRHIPK